MLTAWADESGSRPDLDPGTYLMSAALCDEDDVDALRETMRTLRRPTETKVHWHGRRDDHRFELVDSIAGLPFLALTVVHSEAGAGDRRHRRKCLEYLLPHLADIQCSTITFESRGQLDASDIDAVGKLRARRVVPTSLRIEHRIGRAEPALWIADVVCEAVVQSRIGNARYLERLGSSVEIQNIP